MGVKSIIQTGDWVAISFGDKPDVNLQGLLDLRTRIPGRIKVQAGPPQMISVKKAPDTKEHFANWLLSVFQAIAPLPAP